MQYLRLLAGVSLIVLANFCGELQAQVAPPDFRAAQVLRDRIAALLPRVRADEAQLVAECAYFTAAQLRRDYGVIGGPPSFQTFSLTSASVNAGYVFSGRRIYSSNSTRSNSGLSSCIGRKPGPETGENIIVSLSQPKGSRFEKESFSIAGGTPAICSGRRLRPTIVRGSKTAIMPPSRAGNSQPPQSLGLRIRGTRT